ncbi:MAG: SRPBCC family protein [Dehalococcoidia bacterium]
MAISRLIQTIDCTIEEAFLTVSNVSTFPEWNPTVKEVERTSDGVIGEGTTFRMKIRGMGDQTMELTDFEKDKSVTLTPHSKMFDGGHTFVFTKHRGMTRIDHTLRMQPKGVFKLLSPVFGMMSSRNLRATSEALQEHLEN